MSTVIRAYYAPIYCEFVVPKGLKMLSVKENDKVTEEGTPFSWYVKWNKLYYFDAEGTLTVYDKSYDMIEDGCGWYNNDNLMATEMRQEECVCCGSKDVIENNEGDWMCSKCAGRDDDSDDDTRSVASHAEPCLEVEKEQPCSYCKKTGVNYKYHSELYCSKCWYTEVEH